MNYCDMLDLCYREGIVLSVENFKPPLNGIYISCDGLHAIILANRILDNIPLRNVVLAEELGHHFTLAGNNLPAEHWNRLNRCNYSKDEARAIRWAAIHLIPVHELMQASRDDIITVPKLAEYFQVTPSFVVYRMSLPDAQRFQYQYIM